MGRSLSCCTSPLCNQNPTLSEARQGLRPSDKVAAKASQTELKQFCEFASEQYNGRAVDILGYLAESDDSIVTREDFVRHAEQAGFRGDANIVFDALDASSQGRPRLEELRAQLSVFATGGVGGKRNNSKRTQSNSPRQNNSGRRAGSKRGNSPAPNSSVGKGTGTPASPVTPGVDAQDKDKEKTGIMDASTRSTLGESRRKEAAKSPEPTQDAEDGKAKDGDGGNSDRKGSKENRQGSKGSKETRLDSKGATGKRRRGSLNAQAGDVDRATSKMSCVSLAEGLPYVEKRAASKYDPGTLTVPVAGPIQKDGSPTVDISDFVVLRPLPYELSPPDRNDDNEQRKFVYKGKVIEIPFLPLSDFEPGAKDESRQTGKGWQVVKSKVIGGNLKSLQE